MGTSIELVEPSRPKANSPLVELDMLGALAPTKESTLPSPSESMLYVKIRTKVHRKARVRAILDGVTLCKLVEVALEKYLSVNPVPETEAP